MTSLILALYVNPIKKTGFVVEIYLVTEIETTFPDSGLFSPVVTDGQRRFFIKTNWADRHNMFENKARNLSRLVLLMIGTV